WTLSRQTGSAGSRSASRRHIYRSRRIQSSKERPPAGAWPCARGPPRWGQASYTRSAATCGPCPACRRHRSLQASTSTRTGRSSASAEYFEASVGTKSKMKTQSIAAKTGVGAVEIAVTDPERALRFYRDYVGLTPLPSDGGAIRMGVPARELVVIRPD